MAFSLTNDGVLGAFGAQASVEWAPSDTARAYATEVVDQYRDHHTEVVRNPHLTQRWVAEAVRASRLMEAVQAAIGTSVAVENTFLVIKWPGHEFDIPWHQDGIDDRVELDPDRSVAAWLALTDTTQESGCLWIIPGSQRAGYLPYGKEDDNKQQRGRADAALSVTDQEKAVPIQVQSGSAVLMDMRLLHRSGTNTAASVRVGLNIRYVTSGGILRRDLLKPNLDPVTDLAGNIIQINERIIT